jgi:hypothetical protein
VLPRPSLPHPPTSPRVLKAEVKLNAHKTAFASARKGVCVIKKSTFAEREMPFIRKDPKRSFWIWKDIFV